MDLTDTMFTLLLTRHACFINIFPPNNTPNNTSDKIYKTTDSIIVCILYTYRKLNMNSETESAILCLI